MSYSLVRSIYSQPRHQVKTTLLPEPETRTTLLPPKKIPSMKSSSSLWDFGASFAPVVISLQEKLYALRKALTLKPRHSGCLYRLGMSLRERGALETNREVMHLWWERKTIRLPFVAYFGCIQSITNWFRRYPVKWVFVFNNPRS